MDYFWNWRPQEDWPPPKVVSPEDYGGQKRLNLVCTQTGLPSTAQRKLVREWCRVLPALQGLEFLWLCSRVPQDVFEAACQVPGLRGLYVKWSGIRSLEPLRHAGALESLHLGDSAGIDALDPIAGLPQLKWLGIGFLPRVSRLDPLAGLQQLTGLALSGGIDRPHRVDTLDPIGRIASLRWMRFGNVRPRDKSIAALSRLRRLEFLDAPGWASSEELEAIRRSNAMLPRD